MKKRILSCLLAFSMLLSAAVLFVFPASAEKPSYTEEDYNNLYVQEGLVFQIDFFKNNAIWNPADEGHIEYPFSNFLISPSGNDLNAFYGIRKTSGSKLPSLSTPGESTLGQPITLHGGWISFDPTKIVGSNGALNIDDLIAATGSNASLQLVSKLGIVNTTHAFMLNGVRFNVNTNAEKTQVNIEGAYEGWHLMYAIPAGTVSLPIDGEIADITMTVARPYIANPWTNDQITEDRAGAPQAPGSVGLFYNTEKIFETDEATYFGHDTTGNYVGFNKSTDMSLYAMRAYSRELTADDITLNHFADLAKWFRLDIGGFAALGKTDRLTIATAFSAYDFESTDDLQTLLYTTIDNVIYDVLAEGDTSAACVQFIITAKESGLNISEVRMLPIELRAEVYEAVNALPAEATAADRQGALDDAIITIINTRYSEYVRQVNNNYEDLYVRQDNLLLWVDFFDAKATDGNVYTGVSYDSWVDEYNAVNANPLITDKAAAIMDVRNNRVETPRPNNWAEMLDRYVKRGKEYFEPLDISDRNYPHTNIRTYGDGALICTLNNSVTVKTPAGVDLTYQFVSMPTGGFNYQLNGFRFTNTVRDGALLFQSFLYYAYGGNGTAAPNSAYIFSEVLNRTAAPKALTSADVTLTVDKSVGADPGHFYSNTYDTVTKTYPEVAEKGPDTTDRITYYGRMNFKAYANGTLIADIADKPLANNDIASVGNSGANVIYAIRTYDCVLSAAEIRQNHFADLAGYYRFDLSAFMMLTEEQKTNLYDALASLELGGSREAAIDAYQAAVNGYYYNLPTETENAQNFLALAETNALDITNLRAISPQSRERVYEVFSEIDPNSEWLYPILQGMLEEAIDEVTEAYYAESVMHRVIGFEGYQLRLYGDTGLRALYTLDEALIAALEARDVTITVGLLSAKAAEDGTFPSTEVTVTAGVVETAAGVTASVIYTTDGGLTGNNFKRGNVQYFTENYFSEQYTEQIKFAAYVVLSEEGQEDLIWYANPTKIEGAEGVSIASVSSYAKRNLGWAYPNVQKVTNAVETEEDMVFYAGDASIHEYTIVKTGDNDAAIDTIIRTIHEYVGITLYSVDAANLTGSEPHLLYIGNCDSTYEDSDCYGITVRGGNFYLWYNDAANQTAAINYLKDVLNASQAAGECVLPLYTDLVRKQR